MINFSAKMKKVIPKLDLTTELEESSEIIASEIRGNIKRGTDPTEQVSHRLNARDYAEVKVKKLGQAKPLVAFYQKLIEKGSYVTQTMGMNHVVLRLSNAMHPKANASIAAIGSWNHFGTSKIPARPFFKVSQIASKRVMAKLADKITRLIRG